MTTIGPTFGRELAAAGVLALAQQRGVALRFDLGTGALLNADELPLTVRTAYAAVLAAHDPTKTIVPGSVTRRQMLLGLALAGFITTEEAVAAATTGAVPAGVQMVFDALPAEQQPVAKITWAAMSQCERSNALVGALASAHGISDAEVDDLFRAWAQL